MDFESVMAKLGLSDPARRLQIGWESSQQSMPAGAPFFLAPEFVAQACEEATLSPEVAQAAISASRRIAGSPALRALAWHLHYSLFRQDHYPREDTESWPSLEGALQEDAGLFYLLVLLSGMPELREINRTHEVPREVVRDTLSDIQRWIGGGEEDEPARPPWGLRPHALGWLVNHLRGELYRLGRLQFQFGSLQLQVRAFRHRASNLVVALSEEGIRYRQDGGRATGDQKGEAGAWLARLAMGDGEVSGYPILPIGRALHRQVTLSAADWQQVLGSGQPVLHVHIPAGSPLSPDLCAESMRLATQFFPRHFPERPFDAFCCGSWLLEAELEQFLPATSNIVRFQREFYLVPIPSHPRYFLSQIFGEAPQDLTKAPRNTSLQRAILEFLEAGGELRPAGGGGFLLPQDLDWGAQVYRRQSYPW
jgi:hypothetical protein